MPLVEALVGSASNDLFEAIFDVQVNENDYDLFDDSDADMDSPALHSLHSRESLEPYVDRRNATSREGKRKAKKSRESPSPVPQIRTRQPSLGRISSERPQRGKSSSARNSPRLHPLLLGDLNTDDMINSPEVVTTTTMSNQSPLAKLFASRFLSPPMGSSPREEGNINASQAARQAAQAATNAEASVRRIETLLGDVKDLPVQKLKDEMKELQVSFLGSL